VAMRGKAIPLEVRRRIIQLAARGKSYAQILAEVDVAVGTVSNVLRPLGGWIRPEYWQPSSARLSLEDRMEIKIGLERGETMRAIGGRIGRNASTICREVNSNGGREHYRPFRAHKQACEKARRPKPTKLSANDTLRQLVTAELECLRSPQQIAAKLRADFDDRPEMWVSHETIYKSLYVQGRGELRRELYRCLRTGRAKRVRRGRIETRGRIPDMVMISERPAEADDRAVPGHWEGDLIMGKNGKTAIGTLVERATRYVMLLHLPDGFNAEAVRTAMTEIITTLPESLRRSLAWDQGREMAQHVRFTVDTGVPVYFCDPHSPWQRGSNENTNGLLRQYFPKGTDLSIYSRADLDAAADSLNTRPRQTLGWMSPSEKLAEFVAMTG
jgi:transposase, IS30 family